MVAYTIFTLRCQYQEPNLIKSIEFASFPAFLAQKKGENCHIKLETPSFDD